MSEKELSVEVYRAFVQTKPTEFDAFLRQWRMVHPEAPVVEVLVAESEAVQEVRAAFGLETMSEDVKEDQSTVMVTEAQASPSVAVLPEGKSDFKKARKSRITF
jgi:hypothetical protein